MTTNVSVAKHASYKAAAARVGISLQKWMKLCFDRSVSNESKRRWFAKQTPDRKKEITGAVSRETSVKGKHVLRGRCPKCEGLKCFDGGFCRKCGYAPRRSSRERRSAHEAAAAEAKNPRSQIPTEVIEE